ncbi:MAG: DUF4231 domain-containing protein [Chloroflexi bacterium]|nr:DUF4231 domain-containing protein [Chloroflexota bacterium]
MPAAPDLASGSIRVTHSHTNDANGHLAASGAGASSVSIVPIDFPGGKRAQAALLAAGMRPAAALHALAVPPARALVLVAGSANSLDADVALHLGQLFSRGLARAVRRSAAIVVDGGTDAGAMALVGQTLGDQPDGAGLIGVAPAGAVSYPGGPDPVAADAAPLEPHHPRFVLVEGHTWGDETEPMFDLIDALCAGGRAVTVLAGGGRGAANEVLRSVRRGWPVVVIAGSQGLADEIAQAVQNPLPFIADPTLAEIVADGKLHIVQLQADGAQFDALLVGLLTNVETLRLCWQRFATYDHNANLNRRRAERLQNAILILGVVSTLLVVLQAQWQTLAPVWPPVGTASLFADGLHGLIILVPIVISVVAAIVARNNVATRWVLLRGAAESIKREIFRYRMRAGIYGDRETDTTSREVKLARQVAALTEHVMQTNVNMAGLEPYAGPIPPAMSGASGTDDGLSFLTPERYVAIRVADQLVYYRLKSHHISQRIGLLRTLILVAGGAGTFVAAVDHQLWVALATALVTAFSAYLQYQQLEYTLVKYNQSETSLANVEAWWTALAPDEQADERHWNKLVDATEGVLQADVSGWVEQMQDALAKLQSAAPEVTGDQPTGGSSGAGSAGGSAGGSGAPGAIHQPSADAPSSTHELARHHAPAHDPRR